LTTKHFYFTGKASWPKVFSHYYDNYEGQKKWKITLYPDKESIAALKEAGLRLRAKKDESGTSYTFSRPFTKDINGEIIEFDPPTVLNADNTPFTEKGIGNGSTVTLKVSVFDTRMGKGHRLDTVRVEELVPYVPAPKDEGPGTTPKVGLPF
jgi:hypothetical protein